MQERKRLDILLVLRSIWYIDFLSRSFFALRMIQILDSKILWKCKTKYNIETTSIFNTSYSIHRFVTKILSQFCQTFSDHISVNRQIINFRGYEMFKNISSISLKENSFLIVICSFVTGNHQLSSRWCWSLDYSRIIRIIFCYLFWFTEA